MSDYKDIRLLLVDNSQSMRAILLHAINCSGIKQQEVTSSENQAYDLYERSNPDIIIYNCDQYPINGIRFTRNIRKERKQRKPVSIMLMSGNSSEFVVKLAINAGVNEFLLTPFKINDFSKRIKNIIKRPRTIIEVDSYFGPDRRRMLSRAYNGNFKRRSDTVNAQWPINLHR